MRRIVLLTILAVLGAALPWAAPAQAIDQGSLGTVSPDKQVVEKSFLPITGVYPNARLPLPDEVPSEVPRGAEPFANFKPEMCRSANWCDTIVLDIDYPPDYIYEVFFGVAITLTWDNPRSEDNPTGDDLDFFLWPNDDPTSGAPSSACRSPGATECDNLHPEIITMIEPQDTVQPKGTPAADDVPPILLTVVNHIGVNTGYNVRAEWFTFDVDFEDFTKPRRGGPKIDDGSSGESTPAGIDPSSLRGVQGPRADRKIVLPGTDGELVEMELPLLAAGNLVAQPINEGGVSLLALALAGVGAVVVGLGTVTVIRRRRLARTTA